MLAIAYGPRLIRVRGAANYELANYEESVSDCTHAIQLDPLYALAYYTRGLSHKATNNQDQSELDHARAIELDPDVYIIHDDLA